MADHAVSLRQRTAGRHYVIENEAALVHGWKQVRAGEVIANVGNRYEYKTKQPEQARPLQRPPQPAFVEVDHAQEKPAEMGFLGRQQALNIFDFRLVL